MYKCDLDIIKYIFCEVKNSLPELFLEKDNIGNCIFNHVFYGSRDLKITKYILKFIENNYPSLLLEKLIRGTTMHDIIYEVCRKYNYDFKVFTFNRIKNNCPEIIIKNNEWISSNHLILPLTFQIQN